VYDGGLSDLALVTRAMRCPVIAQDYLFDEYQIVEARAAGASSVVLYADVLDPAMLRVLVSATQRNRMTAIVQVYDARQLAFAQFLSPQAIALGDQRIPFSAIPSMDTLWRLRMSIPRGTQVMISYPLETLDDVEAVAPLYPDAVLLSEHLLMHEHMADTVRRMLAATVRPG
jgi:indole-3-glycerol phosphate synthase